MEEEYKLFVVDCYGESYGVYDVYVYAKNKEEAIALAEKEAVGFRAVNVIEPPMIPGRVLFTSKYFE